MWGRASLFKKKITFDFAQEICHSNLLKIYSSKNIVVFLLHLPLESPNWKLQRKYPIPHIWKMFIFEFSNFPFWNNYFSFFFTLKHWVQAGHFEYHEPYNRNNYHYCSEVSATSNKISPQKMKMVLRNFFISSKIMHQHCWNSV